MKIDFIGGTYTGRSVAVDSQECVNFYPEYADPNSKNNIILIGTPGLKLYTTVTGFGSIRKIYSTATNRLFVVMDNNLIEILANKTKKIIGALKTNTGFVSISENPTQLMVVDGASGYIYYLKNAPDPLNPFVEISSSQYESGTHVINNNNFFVQNVGGSGKFIFSNNLDGLTWNALNFYTAQMLGEDILSIETINNELWMFSKNSLKIWYNKGPSSTDPFDIFEPVNNVFIDIGLSAEQSVAKINNSIFWLGNNQQGNNIVWMTNGYIPKRISNHSIEYLIGQIDDTSDATGYCYQQEGHMFYVLNFTSGNKTLTYDLATGLWHERGFWNKVSGCNDRHRGQQITFYNGKNLVTDYISGNIYEYDLDYYTDNGTPIRRIRTGGHIHSDRQRLFFREFEIDLERGIGIQNPINETTTITTAQYPQACLQWSDDGGFTWSNEYWGCPGVVGNYKARLHWHRLGYSRDRVFRVHMSDPVKWILIDARADIEKES